MLTERKLWIVQNWVNQLNENEVNRTNGYRNLIRS